MFNNDAENSDAGVLVKRSIQRKKRSSPPRRFWYSTSYIDALGMFDVSNQNRCAVFFIQSVSFLSPVHHSV